MTDEERQALLDKLYAPFDASLIKQRDGGNGRTFDYVETYTVIQRLNEATDNSWSSEIIATHETAWGNALLITAQVRLLIEGLGHRDGHGVQIVYPGKGGEDLFKGAQSDALKNAAAKFGVALALYGPDPVAGEFRSENGSTPAQKPLVNGMPNRVDREGLKQERNQNNPATEKQGKMIYAKWMGIYGDSDGLTSWVSSMCDGVSDTRKITFSQASELIDLLKAEEEKQGVSR